MWVPIFRSSCSDPSAWDLGIDDAIVFPDPDNEDQVPGFMGSDQVEIEALAYTHTAITTVTPVDDVLYLEDIPDTPPTKRLRIGGLPSHLGKPAVGLSASEKISILQDLIRDPVCRTPALWKRVHKLLPGIDRTRVRNYHMYLMEGAQMPVGQHESLLEQVSRGGPVSVPEDIGNAKRRTAPAIQREWIRHCIEPLLAGTPDVCRRTLKGGKVFMNLSSRQLKVCFSHILSSISKPFDESASHNISTTRPPGLTDAEKRVCLDRMMAGGKAVDCFAAVRAAVPGTTVASMAIRKFRDRILSCVSVPVWLHERLLKQPDATAAATLFRGSPEGKKAHYSAAEIVRVWNLYCIEPLLDGVPIDILAHPRPGPEGYLTLSPRQQSAYLTDVRNAITTA